MKYQKTLSNMAVIAAVSTAVVATAVGGAIQSGEAHKSMVNARNAKKQRLLK